MYGKEEMIGISEGSKWMANFGGKLTPPPAAQNTACLPSSLGEQGRQDLCIGGGVCRDIVES